MISGFSRVIHTAQCCSFCPGYWSNNSLCRMAFYRWWI